MIKEPEILNNGPCTTLGISGQLALRLIESNSDSILFTDFLVNDNSFFTLPDYQFSNEYSSNQPYYDAISGAQLYMSVDELLSENINFTLYIDNYVNDNRDVDSTENINELFKFNFLVVGENSGTHDLNETYNFTENQYAELEFSRYKLKALLNEYNVAEKQFIAY